MVYFIRSKKIDLIIVLLELGLSAQENDYKTQLTEIIVKSDGCKENLVKTFLEVVVSERKVNENT